MRPTVAMGLFLGLSFALFSVGARAAGVAGAREISFPGCNSIAFEQLPDNSDLFVGRILNNTDPDKPCSGNTWSLVLEHMDWDKRKLERIGTFLQTPAEIMDGSTVRSAYDSSAVRFNGEDWIAYECAIKGLRGANACLSPFDGSHPESGPDLSRTNVVVHSGSAVSGPYTYSASVPKLLVFQNRLYLYWSAIRLLDQPPRTWLDITTRGMELVQEPGGKRLFWGKGANGPVDSFDPAHNVEVWGLTPDEPQSNQRAEMFSARAFGNVIYATGVLGGTGCLAMADKVPGCSRLAVAVSQQPLGKDVFNQHLLPETELPTNAVAYTRINVRPDGSRVLMGFGDTPRSDERSLPRGLFVIPLPDDAPIWKFGAQLANSP